MHSFRTSDGLRSCCRVRSRLHSMFSIAPSTASACLATKIFPARRAQRSTPPRSAPSVWRYVHLNYDTSLMSLSPGGFLQRWFVSGKLLRQTMSKAALVDAQEGLQEEREDGVVIMLTSSYSIFSSILRYCLASRLNVESI